MRLRRVLDLVLQSGNIIVVLGCVLALLAAQQYSTSIVQVTTLTEAQPSTTTVTTTVTQQPTTTASTTCTPGHCSFTEVITQSIGVSASLGGEARHTTTMLNPAALSSYQFFANLGEFLAIVGLIFSLANFSIWLYHRH